MRRHDPVQRGSGRIRLRSMAGFTLIELLVVIALITILASMGVVQYRKPEAPRKGKTEGDAEHVQRSKPPAVEEVLQ